MLNNNQLTNDIFSNIVTSYYHLSKAECRVADYILQHKHQTHLMSITELATASQVSESTVSRFCQNVGYRSYSEFRISIATALSRGTRENEDTDLYSNILPTDSIDLKSHKLCSISIEALNATLEEMDDVKIGQAVQMLSEARSVFCFGQGNSSIIAEDAWGRFACVSPKFHFIANANLQITTAQLLRKGDVILYFSYSGSIRELIEMGELLRGSEAKLILITRLLNSPGAQFADLVLICGANESHQQQGSIAAKISQLFIIDVLFHEFCALNNIPYYHDYPAPPRVPRR